MSLVSIPTENERIGQVQSLVDDVVLNPSLLGIRSLNDRPVNQTNWLFPPSLYESITISPTQWKTVYSPILWSLITPNITHRYPKTVGWFNPDPLQQFNIQPKPLDLRRGEIKEVEDGIFIKKTETGLLEFFVTEE